MQPNQPYYPAPPPPPNVPNQYDFILNGDQKPSNNWKPGGSSTLQRIVIVGVLGVILLIIIIGAFSFLGSAGKADTESLYKIGQQQAELARIAAIGAGKGRDTKVRSLAVTTELSMATAQQKTIALIKKQGVKADAKRLASGKNSRTDQTLTSAELNNRFDETFTQLLQQQLDSYKQSLQTAYNATDIKAVKDALKESFTQASVLADPDPAKST